MSPVSKICAALAAFGLLTLITPSAALAHAGHDHRSSVQSQATPSDAAQRAGQELRAADIVVAHADHDHGCGDRGCCGSGHCAGCVTAIAPSALAEFSPLPKSLRLTFDAILPPGLGTSGPPRPPRSFV